MSKIFPSKILNWTGGQECLPSGDAWLEKKSPVTGDILCHLARSSLSDVSEALSSAEAAKKSWALLSPVKRGEILHSLALVLRKNRETMAKIVSTETGKNLSSALAETDAAISLGLFYAGEGQRLYGRTTTSTNPNRMVMTVREPLGIAGLIVAANTPIANVAWKVFPALICGNTAVLKAAEDTPATAWYFAQLSEEAGVPAGVLNVLQGVGSEAGALLVSDSRVDLLSFTGSTTVGRWIASRAGERLCKLSLELGGKNPFVVCDDADLENAVHWALLSAFSNAGQRCASASRFLVFEKIYEAFRNRFVERAKQLKLGPEDGDDFGPVINARQLNRMIEVVKETHKKGATLLTGGDRLHGKKHDKGCYMAPTLLDNVSHDDEISKVELFGPIACLYKVKDFEGALALANDSPYGLTACIHTKDLSRALDFTRRVQAGAVMVNAGTFGSEPHMPFGGVKQSGNGSREPGTEALDIYSNLKDIYLNI